TFANNYNWRNRKNPCAPAFYGKDRTISKNILASDLGMIAKKAEDGEYHVFVTNLKTAQPVPNAEVKFYNYQQRALATKTTDPNGKVVLNSLKDEPHIIVAQLDGEYAYLRINGGNALSVSNFEVSGKKVKEGLKGFVYGERGVWRPGDSLFFTLILEDRKNLYPQDLPVVFEFKNPQGQIIKRKAVSENVNGMYRFTTNTSEDAPTGIWSLVAKAGGTKFYKSVKIETIKPNRLKINLDFGKEELTYKDINLEGDLQVNWLHGAVGANMKSEFTLKLKESTVNFEKYANYTFSNTRSYYNSEEQSVFDGKTDSEGHATFNADLEIKRNAPTKLQAVFNGKVYEPSGNYSIAYKALPFYPYETMLGVQISGTEKSYGFIETDKNHSVNIVCVDKDQTPITRQGVSVKLYKLNWRWWWDYDNGRYNYNNSTSRELISTGKVDLKSGKGKWDFKVEYPSWGRYLVEVKDPVSGHVSRKIFYVDWPYWRGSSKRGMKEGAAILALSSDKDKYNVGDEVKIKVPASKGGKVLVSIENGSSILKSFWVDAKSNVVDVKFKVDQSMAPNVYASVLVLQEHMQTKNDLPIRMYGVLPIMVENPNTHLKPIIQMPEVIEPFQEVNIKVAEEQGKDMTFTLAVVDEGLLDLTNFRTPEPWKYFYAKEALGVKTWDLFDDVIGAYSGDLQHLLAIGGDMSKKGEKENKVKRFKPVVKYFGPYHVKGGSSKTISFKMPNYVGSVKTMVVASQNGSYGHADQTTPVRQPLMVLGTMPRVLAPNEVIDIPVSVFATDNTIQNAKVSLELNEYLEIIGSSTKELIFAKPGEQLVTFKVKVKNSLGAAKVKIKGTGNGKVSLHEIDVEVRSPNPEIIKTFDKVLSSGEEWTSSVTKFGVKGTNELTLEVSTLPSINLDKRLNYLIQYPHGCIEQTTSSVFPQLFLDKVTNLTEFQKQRINANVQSGVERLYKFKAEEGGLSYWPGSGSYSSWGTSYATHFMVLAKKQGYDVDEQFLNKVLNFMKRKSRRFSSLKSYARMQQAYRLYVLALANKADLSAMNRLAQSTNLTSNVRYRLAAAYALLNKKEMANKLLVGYSVKNEEKSYSWRWYTYGSYERDQAMVLETFILLDRKAEAFSLLKELADKLGSDRWYSTQTTSYSLLAYSQFVNKFGKGKTATLTYEYNENGKKEWVSNDPVARRSFDVTEKNTNQLSLKNTGDQMIFVRVFNKGIPLEPQTENISSKLEMEIWYETLDGKRIDVSDIKQGTEFKSFIKVHNPGFFGHYRDLALSQIVPSGWEIRNTRLNEGATGLESKTNYVDIRDDRINLYFGLRRGVTKVFEIELHASFVGSYSLPPVLCTAMYDDTIKAQKGGRKVQVSK
ncbi:MG2 domain-containing protein, partial [Cyclobacteriaceae bacterium]|nr:MG2 domain-containing protein [Cyclobacteriaceae bacterium]